MRSTETIRFGAFGVDIASCLLIYKIVDDELRLVRTGRHVDLFQE